MNEKKTYYTVYKTTNILNEHFYVGVHKTIDPNDGYLGSGLIIKQAIEKYGKENFKKEILFIFDNLQDAYKKENEIVNSEFIRRTDTYNIAIGGSISPDHVPGRIYRCGESHHSWGKKVSEESNRKRSMTLAKTNALPETKENRSIGAKKAEITRKMNGYTAWNDGKHLSDSDKFSKSIGAKNREKIQCPHCNARMDSSNAKKYHFDNCKKLKPIIEKFHIKYCENCEQAFTTQNTKKRCCNKSCENILRGKLNKRSRVSLLSSN